MRINFTYIVTTIGRRYEAIDSKVWVQIPTIYVVA
jgi:hypothetical protein